MLLPMIVLVVDDNEINSRVYERVLSRLPGCTCRCISKPDAALAWSAENRPALLVVDYVMPELDGIAFVKSFRSLPGHATIPIIMLTGMNSGQVRDQAHAAGADVFLPKPINPERFLSEARRLLKGDGTPKAPE